MDAAAAESAVQVFVEMVAKEGHRRVRPAGEALATQADGFDDPNPEGGEYDNNGNDNNDLKP
jgi:hypothetical protein